MLKHDADAWFLVAQILSACRHRAGARGSDNPIENGDEFEDNLKAVLERVQGLKLQVSATVISRAIDGIGRHIATTGKMVSVIDGIRNTIESELATCVFIQVDNEYAKYYQQKQLFGSEVAARFAAAGDDIEEAGNCIALGRGTACVYHLMRVMEIGLKALANPLGIPYAPSWESYLRQIEAKITAKHSSKSKKWKKEEPFYRDVLGDLQAVKIAWRNPTMHIVRRYTTEEADDILRAVRAFMRRMATDYLS